MKLFAYRQENGCIALASIFEEDTHDPREKIDPNGWFVDPSELPHDSQYWFNCLTADLDKRIYISLDKAREATRNRLRAERKPLLEALDIEFQRSLEFSGKPDQVVIEEKRRLRDITRLVSTCSTVAELKQLSCSK
jgi:hypothetical protein